MLSTPTQQGPTKAPVNVPPGVPATSRGSPGTIGSMFAVGAPAEALGAAALPDAIGGALAGAVAGAVAGALAAGVLEQAPKIKDTTTRTGSSVRLLAPGEWIILTPPYATANAH